jgi:hypothetical protein
MTLDHPQRQELSPARNRAGPRLPGAILRHPVDGFEVALSSRRHGGLSAGEPIVRRCTVVSATMFDRAPDDPTGTSSNGSPHREIRRAVNPLSPCPRHVTLMSDHGNETPVWVAGRSPGVAVKREDHHRGFQTCLRAG